MPDAPLARGAVRCDWCLLCREVTRNAQGAPSLHDIFTSLHAASWPMPPATFQFIARLTGAPLAAARLSVRTLHPNGQVIAEGAARDVALDVSGAAFVERRFAGVQFPHPGVYRFVVVDGEQEIAATSLTVWPASPETTLRDPS
jgi:hypothetical protein